MAIARDANSTGTSVGFNLTFSHTCSGSDRILLVGITTYAGAGGDNVSTVTYNGVAMTRINTEQAGTSTPRGYLYYLINPSTGANDISISCPASGTILAVSSSYTGAKQSGQPDAENSNSLTTGTSQTESVTTIDDNCWLVGWLITNNGSNPTAGAGTSIVFNETASGQTNNTFIDSNGAKTPAGSHSLNITWTGSTRNALMIASIAPSVAAAAPRRLLLLGVGT